MFFFVPSAHGVKNKMPNRPCNSTINNSNLTTMATVVTTQAHNNSHSNNSTINSNRWPSTCRCTRRLVTTTLPRTGMFSP